MFDQHGTELSGERGQSTAFSGEGEKLPRVGTDPHQDQNQIYWPSALCVHIQGINKYWQIQITVMSTHVGTKSIFNQQ